jgi:hypothetical protein
MSPTETDMEPATSKLPANRGRILLAAVAVLVTIAVAAGLTAFLGRSTKRAGVAGGFTVGSGYLTYRSTVQGPDFGKVVEVPLGGLTAKSQPAATLSTIRCERSYTASGVLLCLQSEGDLMTTPYAEVYDSSLKQIKKLPITGMPNRARLSADGRMASWTTFVNGDSYTGPAFSTRTSILDVKTGASVDSLESFTATVDGKRYKAVDINYWGVTFAADDNTFYATMGSNGKTWLMRGDLKARTLTALAENVECPSLSPDGARIVFKKRVSDDIRKPWRLEVLDLKTMAETPLAEQHSVDDQAAWLDAHTVMYALPHSDDPGYDVWSVPADGTGQPAMVAANAFSPAVTS